MLIINNRDEHKHLHRLLYTLLSLPLSLSLLHKYLQTNISNHYISLDFEQVSFRIDKSFPGYHTEISNTNM